jgi:hypothetical protein
MEGGDGRKRRKEVEEAGGGYRLKEVKVSGK